MKNEYREVVIGSKAMLLFCTHSVATLQQLKVPIVSLRSAIVFRRESIKT